MLLITSFALFRYWSGVFLSFGLKWCVFSLPFLYSLFDFFNLRCENKTIPNFSLKIVICIAIWFKWIFVVSRFLFFLLLLLLFIISATLSSSQFVFIDWSNRIETLHFTLSLSISLTSHSFSLTSWVRVCENEMFLWHYLHVSHVRKKTTSKQTNSHWPSRQLFA